MALLKSPQGILNEAYNSTDGTIRTTQSNGIPSEYSKTSQSSIIHNLVKGNLNKLRIRPHIQNEHAESSREIMDVVDSSTVVGQIFKASKDNINGISLTLQSAATFASIDAITSGAGENKAGTMEYSGDAALQAEYIKSGAVEAVRSAFTDDNSVTQDGSYAMKLPMDTLADDWRVTLTSTDLTGVTFSLKYANTEKWNKAKLYFFVGDGTNTKSFPLAINNKNIWQTFTIQETAMTVTANDDTATTPDMTAITKLGFRVDNAGGGKFAYVDTITYQTIPGSVDIELWNMGSALPAGDGTVDYTTGTQYDEIGDRGIDNIIVSTLRLTLVGGKRKYFIGDFIAGVAREIASNTTLTVNNYYAIVLKYVDTDVSVYGPDTTQSTNYYTNGYAFKAEVADNFIDKINGATGSGAYSDLMFQIFSTQKVYINKATLLTDNAPGSDASVSIFVEDENMGITDIITSHVQGGGGLTKLEYDISDRPAVMNDGGKLEAYWDDDPSDSATLGVFIMDYYFEPPIANG